MTLYAVQDSDWDWTSEDGQAILIQAENPEHAACGAIKIMEQRDGDHIDGFCVKVAMVTFGDPSFIMGECHNGKVVLDIEEKS